MNARRLVPVVVLALFACASARAQVLPQPPEPPQVRPGMFRIAQVNDTATPCIMAVEHTDVGGKTDSAQVWADSGQVNLAPDSGASYIFYVHVTKSSAHASVSMTPQAQGKWSQKGDTVIAKWSQGEDLFRVVSPDTLREHSGRWRFLYVHE